jgi:hypothetical protein
MSMPDTPIAVVQGASTVLIQGLFRDFLASLPPATRVVGLIEEDLSQDHAGRCAPQLRSLVDGRAFPLFQDLGAGSTACGLDGERVADACAAVQRDLASGCDLLVLSKFGRLESERSGLVDAFAAAIDLNAPILTSVSPKFEPQWRAFAAPLFVMLPPEADAIRTWWRSVSRPRP